MINPKYLSQKIRWIFYFLEFSHTSHLESLNSLLLKYCSKKDSFGWSGMLVRSALAAIDFNSNIDRKTKTAPDGSLRFKMKVGIDG